VVLRRRVSSKQPAPAISSPERLCCLASMFSGGRERGEAARASSSSPSAFALFCSHQLEDILGTSGFDAHDGDGGVGDTDRQTGGGNDNGDGGGGRRWRRRHRYTDTDIRAPTPTQTQTALKGTQGRYPYPNTTYSKPEYHVLKTRKVLRASFWG